MGGKPSNPRPTECEHCGNPLPREGRRRRFCSEKCSDAAYRIRNRDARNAYNSEWQRQNPDRVREIKRKSQARHREKKNAQERQRGSEGAYATRHQRRQDALGRDAVLAGIRANTLLRRYGLTPEHYDALLNAQDGGCAICAKTPEQNGRRLAIDHDHACCPGRQSCGRCIRGLLCFECNHRLGIVEDEPWMQRAQAFLRNPRGRLEAM